MLTDDDKNWMSIELDRLASKAREGIGAVENRLGSVETSLLNEFHRQQYRADARFQGLEANVRVSHVRLDDLEQRVRKLEEKG